MTPSNKNKREDKNGIYVTRLESIEIEILSTCEQHVGLRKLHFRQRVGSKDEKRETKKKAIIIASPFSKNIKFFINLIILMHFSNKNIKIYNKI